MLTLKQYITQNKLDEEQLQEALVNASKVVVAVRHKRTGKIISGKRKEWHNDVLARVFSDPKYEDDDPYDWEHGFVHTPTKKFHRYYHVSNPAYKYSSSLTSPELADIQSATSVRKDTGKRYTRYKKVKFPDEGGFHVTEGLV